MSKSKNDFKVCNGSHIKCGWITYRLIESISQLENYVLFCICSRSSFFKGKHLDNYFLIEIETDIITTF